MIKKYSKPILVVVTFVAALALLIFIVARASVNDYIDKTNQTTLNHAVSKVNERIEEIQNIAYQMAASNYIVPVRYAQSIFEHSAFIHTLKLQQWLPNYSAYNNYLSMNAIIFGSSNYVIMPQYGQDLESFGRNFSDERMPEGYSDEEFLSFIRKFNKQFLNRMRYNKNTTAGIEVVPYLMWVGDKPTESGIAAMAFLDAQAMDMMLSQTLSSKLGVLCLIDQAGELVAASRTITEQEKSYLLGDAINADLRGYWANTRSTQWRCVLISYGDEAKLALNHFSMLIAIITVACVALVVITVVLLTLHNREMLRSLAGMFGGESEQRQDIYYTINQKVQKMLNDKKLLDARLHEQEAVLRALSINNLLSGNNFDSLIDSNVLPLEKYCLAVILMLQTDHAVQAEIFGVKNVMKEVLRCYSSDIVFCDTSSTEMALSFFMPAEMGESQIDAQLRQAFEAISKVALLNTNFRLRFFVGGVHAGDGAVCRSYSEARMTLLNTMIVDEDEEIVRYNGVESANACYFYPPEAEMRFINAIRSGNRFAVQQQMDELFEKNIVQQSIDYEMTVAFLYDFYGSVIKILPDGEGARALRNEILEYFKNNLRDIGTIEVQKTFINYIYRLTESFSRTKKSHNQTLADQMLAYVDEHIGDYGLSLTLLADAFHLSAGYCSTFFKEQIGITFSDYLMRTRMEKGKELISQSEMSIADIAVAVGYSSSVTFGRAMKKYYGINPLQLRE